MNDLGILPLLRAEWSVEEQRAHSDHTVHGRADLVAHVRQKLALGPVGRLGRVSGLADLVFGPLARADVFLNRDEITDGVCQIAHGGDRHFFRVERAILTAVDEFAAPGASSEDGAPEIPVEVGSLPAGLQDARVLADGFRGAVARHAGKSRVDISNARAGIGDHDSVPSLLNRRR